MICSIGDETWHVKFWHETPPVPDVGKAPLLRTTCIIEGANVKVTGQAGCHSSDRRRMSKRLGRLRAMNNAMKLAKVVGIPPAVRTSLWEQVWGGEQFNVKRREQHV